jgi:hypothetical protein
MDITVVVALVAAVSALLVAVVNAVTGRANQHRLEELKSVLAESQASNASRRDYEYEARKSLYHHIEPLRFQFVVAADSAFERITGMARTSRNGDLHGASSWLAGPIGGYYLSSTVYRLLVPFSLLRIARKQLTLVDLTLDQQIRAWFTLAGRHAVTFGEDFALAQTPPELAYDPDSAPPVMTDPAVQRRQGIYLGLLESAADALTVADKEKATRVMTFGEFQSGLEHSEALQAALLPVFDLFSDFHPAQRPVAWRILITQAHLYRAMINVAHVPDFDSIDWTKLVTIPSAERAAFDWRTDAERGSVGDDDVLRAPFDAAVSYLVPRLVSAHQLFLP